MAAKGKEYKLAIRIAGVVDKSYDMSLVRANGSLKALQANITKIDAGFTQMDKVYNKIMKVGRKAFEVVEKAALGASIAVAGVTAASVKLGSDFEAEMSTVQSISGATTAELAKLSDKAREVARSTVFSATEVGQAMEYMGMAGWKTEQILSGVSGVVDLAAASGEDLGLVSDIVTDSLTAMGQTAADSGHFADVLAAAAMNSNTNVEQLGYAFKYAAPMAGSLGYNIEDLTVAMGVMASSGIKASVAGTTMRNIMTRMVKPTAESRDAMEALGLSLTDSEGNMLSFMDIMKQLRKAYGSTSNKEGLTGAIKELAGLTDDQIEEIQSNLGDLTATEEAFYAAELGGARGISGLLAIANTSEEEFNKLVDAIYNAEGAAEEMANVRLDNLQGDVTILRDTAADAAIELYYQFNTTLREVIQSLTGDISGLAKHIPTVFKKLTGSFSTLKRKFMTTVKPVFEAIVSTFGWVKENGATIASTIAGIGAALATYKVLSTIAHTVKAVMDLAGVLGKFGPVVGGVIALVGLLAAKYVSLRIEHEKLIKTNLNEHFGDIALSMGQLQKAAEEIISSDSLTKVRESLSEFDELEGIQQEIDDAVGDLNRMNWMIKVGIELDEGDREDYKAAVDNYIEGLQDYMTQERYAVSLSLASFLDASNPEEASVIKSVEDFYATQQGKLHALGQQLGEAVTEGFNDDLFNIDVDKVQQIQSQIAEIQQKIQLGEASARFAVISSKYAGKLTADSFQNLQAEMNAAVEEATGAVDESLVKELAYLYNANLGAEELATAETAAKKAATEQKADINAKAAGYIVESIMEQYGSEVAQQQQAIADALTDLANSEYVKGNEGAVWATLIDDIANAGPAKDTKLAISELMEGMEDTREEIYRLLTEEENLTDERRKQLESLVDDMNMLKGMTYGYYGGIFGNSAEGDPKALSDYVASVVDESGKYSSILKFRRAIDEMYSTQAPEEEPARRVLGDVQDFKSQIEDLREPTQVMTEEMQVFQTNIDSLKGSTQAASEEIKLFQSRLDALRSWTATRGTSYPGVGSHATGGIIRRPELSTLAENGPEAVIPLDGSARAQALYDMTGRLLGGMGGSPITFSPTIQFYGGTPNRSDIDGALEMSQNRFNDMMNNYLARQRRLAF